MIKVMHNINKPKLLCTIISTLLLILCLTPLVSFAQDNNVELNLQIGKNSGFKGFYGILYDFVTGVFGKFVIVSGWLLDQVVLKYTIGFSETFATSGVGGAVDNLWSLIRDIFNIALIFGLIYVGIKMVLTSANSATKRNLVTLIIAAIFVNFSLYFAKLILDFSNLLATQIYDLIILLFGGDNQSIAVGYLNVLELSSAFGISDVETTLSTGGMKLTYIFGLMIFLLVTSIVFFAGAFLLFVRFIAVNIYLVFAPIMFLGYVFPNMQSVSSKYLSDYLKRCFVAPAYLFMIYLSLVSVASMADKLSAPNYANSLTANDDTSLGVFIIFIMGSAFMIASVVVAQKMGAEGGNASMRVINNIGGRARRGVKNTALYVPRRAARGATGAASRGMRRLDNRLLGSTSRRGAVARGALGMVGLDARTRNNALTQGENARFGARYSSQDNINNNRTQTNRRNEQQNRREREASRDESLDIIEERGSAATDVNDAMQELATTIRNLTNQELTTMNLDQLTNHNVAANLSDAQIDSLASSGRFTNDQINTIRNTRNGAQINIARTGTATVDAGGNSTNAEMSTASRGAGATAAQIHAADQADHMRERLVARGSNVAGNLRPQVFMESDMYNYITPEMVEQRMRNGLSEADRIAIRDAVSDHLGVPHGTPPPANTPWDRWYQRSSNGARMFS